MKNLPIIIFRLKGRKEKGLYAACALILVAVAGFTGLALSLYLSGQKGVALSLLFAIALALVLAFLCWAIYRMKREGDDGIIVSNEGITDRSTGYDVGVILWKDIEEIRVMTDLESEDRRYLVLRVSNPNDYILREPTLIKKRSLTLKLHYYGSPICLSVRALDCTFEQLETAVRLRFDEYRANEVRTVK